MVLGLLDLNYRWWLAPREDNLKNNRRVRFLVNLSSPPTYWFLACNFCVNRKTCLYSRKRTNIKSAIFINLNDVFFFWCKDHRKWPPWIVINSMYDEDQRRRSFYYRPLLDDYPPLSVGVFQIRFLTRLWEDLYCRLVRLTPAFAKMQ